MPDSRETIAGQIDCLNLGFEAVSAGEFSSSNRGGKLPRPSDARGIDAFRMSDSTAARFLSDRTLPCDDVGKDSILLQLS